MLSPQHYNEFDSITESKYKLKIYQQGFINDDGVDYLDSFNNRISYFYAHGQRDFLNQLVLHLYDLINGKNDFVLGLGDVIHFKVYYNKKVVFRGHFDLETFGGFTNG